MSSTSDFTRRISNRQMVMLVCDDAHLMESLIEVFGAYGELALTTCSTLDQVAELLLGRRPDACVARVSCGDDVSVLRRLFDKSGAIPVIALVAPGSHAEAEVADIAGVIGISQSQPAAEIRCALLAALVSARWQAA